MRVVVSRRPKTRASVSAPSGFKGGFDRLTSCRVGLREIPPFRLIPEPLNDEAAALPGFRWAKPDIGTRHRLGGCPDAIQPLEYPTCPECGEEMNFYPQLDSINDEFVLGDVGLVYVSVCFYCTEAQAIVQTY
jgi:hypothetical protein